ncbi:MAG: hypothetical protein JWR02_2306 [Mucilaginibacter sp.]|nr:hypothetical protein [Mucilaginibacter sp.]
MFQYASAKALSLKHNQQLLIDTSFLTQNPGLTEGFTRRNYELNIFQLNTAVAGERLIKSFKINSFYNKALKLLKLPYNKVHYEVPSEDASQLDKITFPVCLSGYWQSEQYFAGYRKEIREEYKFPADAIDELKPFIDQIYTTNSVSIHFRRGDYLNNPAAHKLHGILDMEYYMQAIKKIQSEIQQPFFYIFSDDPEWVKENVQFIENYKVVDGGNPNRPWHDMLLMSKCKHHIIANSSFSWWGAWLNDNCNKLVIAPKRWFADEQINAHAAHIVPKEWIRI